MLAGAGLSEMAVNVAGLLAAAGTVAASHMIADRFLHAGDEVLGTVDSTGANEAQCDEGR